MPSHNSIQIRKDGVRSQKISSGQVYSHETEKFWVYRKPDTVIESMEPRYTRLGAIEEVVLTAKILYEMKFSQDLLS